MLESTKSLPAGRNSMCSNRPKAFWLGGLRRVRIDQKSSGWEHFMSPRIDQKSSGWEDFVVLLPQLAEEKNRL